MSTVIDGSNSVTINSGAVLGITSGTAVASTSGTSIDFTSIPSWVKRITVLFSGVSTSGTSVVQIQLGSGSVTTTGYLANVGSVAATANTTVANTLTSGIPIVSSQQASASNTLIGKEEIVLFGSNLWIASGIHASGNAGGINYNSGNVTLSGTLDRVRITTVNGTDTFDAGSINILYE